MKNNKKVFIFLGSYAGKNFDVLKNYYFKKSLSFSNGEFERVLFENFKKNNECVFISAPAIGYWPRKSKKAFFSSKSCKEEDNLQICSYFTIFMLSHISKQISMYKKAREIIRFYKKKNYDLVLIACEAHRPYLEVLQKTKKKYGIKTALIVPDLPQNMYSSQTRIYNFFKKINSKKVICIAEKYVDAYWFFTNSISNKIPHKNKPFIVREGIIESFNINKTYHKTTECTYIGKTDSWNGINFIVEAAKQIPDFAFNIYGSGELDNYLKELKIPNLKYHGYVNPDNVNQILLDSDVLLSPRDPCAPFSSDSFPSKVLKYCSVCKPIVTFKLSCYGEKFDNLFFYPKELTFSSFSTTILEAAKNADNMKIKYEKNLNQLLVENIVSSFMKIL